MGEYEPDDSRTITQNPSNTPIEPARTGPSENKTRGVKKSATPSTAKPGKFDKKELARWQVSENSPLELDDAKPNAGT